jgi:hypothetical protein
MNSRQINASAFSDFISCPSLYYYKNKENFAEIIFRQNENTKNGEILNNIIGSHFKGIPVSESFTTSNPDLKKWWEYYLEKYQATARSEVFNEWCFNLPFETANEKVILSGKIDRFIIEENKIIIYNWRVSPKGGLADFVNKQQMELYCYVLSRIKKIEQFDIKTVNFTLKEESTIKIDLEYLLKIEQKLLNMIKKTNPLIKVYIPDPVYLENIGRACKVCHFYRLCENLL